MQACHYNDCRKSSTDEQRLLHASLMSPCILIAWSRSMIDLDFALPNLMVGEAKCHIIFTTLSGSAPHESLYLCEFSLSVRVYKLIVERIYLLQWRRDLGLAGGFRELLPYL